jgi:hypothetical protein
VKAACVVVSQVFGVVLFPTLVWTSAQGYNHQEVGRKVSQIQAVLARRCAAVGELQQHLLRAGWHRGVAQWGGMFVLRIVQPNVVTSDQLCFCSSRTGWTLGSRRRL